MAADEVYCCDIDLAGWRESGGKAVEDLGGGAGVGWEAEVDEGDEGGGGVGYEEEGDYAAG